jgi:3',5'-cyclic AMP phosphodiesterase CpdA
MKFLLISDTHIGGQFNEEMFYKGVEIANQSDVDFLIHCGDLTSDGTLAQYELSKMYLEKITKKPFLIVPGNHDGANVGDLLWEEIIGTRYFVHTDEEKKVKIFGLDSSEPDRNTGRIGRKAIQRIYDEFSSLTDDWLKVIVFHHHCLPIPYTGRERSSINDAGSVIKTILDCNIQLVFNGHRHITNVFRLTDGEINAWIVNCGTLSCKKTRYREEYSMTIVNVNREKNEIATKILKIGKEPTEEEMKFSGIFQENVEFKEKELVSTIVQIGNTDFSDAKFNLEVYEKGVQSINNMNCDLVVHCGGVTGSSYLNEFKRAQLLLDKIKKPLLIVPGGNDSSPLGYDLFSRYIGLKNPIYENDKLLILGFNSCIIDEKEGRLGRDNTNFAVEKLTKTSSKIGIVTFYHTIIPLPRTKHEAELTDAGDVLNALTQNNLDLVLTGAKNRSATWQVNNTVLVNAGTLSSLNVNTYLGNSFNIIEIFKTEIGKYYEISEYIIEEDKKMLIGTFNVPNNRK